MTALELLKEGQAKARADAVAYKFGKWSKDPWQAGLLVARSCVVGKDTDKQNLMQIQTKGKITSTKFAEVAGVSHDSVTRYQKRWQAAFDRGWVKNTLQLVPGETFAVDPNIHTLEAWTELGRKAPVGTDRPAPGGQGIWITYGVPLADLQASIIDLKNSIDGEDPQTVTLLLESLVTAKGKLTKAIERLGKRAVKIKAE
ncbi:MAG: hypothetical protein QOE51_4557 [Actinoplanes sp.]|jgi:hypothetical protein|nr:hypothetical protein [Actinoplanes sp.]